MFSINSFHDFVIPISLNFKWIRRAVLLLSSFLFSIPATIILFTLKGVSLLQCHHVKVFFYIFFLFFLCQFQTYNSGHLWFSAPSVWQSYHGRPSTSPAATPFSAYVCLILGGVVWPGLGVWGVMLRDFQLMGWRGWEGEEGRERERASGGYRIGGEKRRGRVDGRAKCFGPESIGADYLPEKETTKVKWKLKRLQWSAGNSFFMRNCTVLHQRIEAQYLNPFYYKRQ